MTAWHQITGLVQLGVKVDLYCASCELPIQGLNHLKETFKYLGVKLPMRVLGSKAMQVHDLIVARALSKLKGQISIVHCWPSGAFFSLLMANRLGIRTVLERPSAHTRYVYDVTLQECNKLGINLISKHYASYNERTLMREEKEFRVSDKLLCPSEFVASTFRQKGFSEVKLARHQYGYDTKTFSREDNCPKDMKRRSLTVVYVGECNPLKGLHFALEAWVKSAASKTGKFYICGRFVPGYQQVLNKWLHAPGIEYLGFVKDVAAIMRRCDVLVMPSLAEGSALVTYEARACGNILLVSSSSGAICKHMENALVHTPGDVDTLRDHIDLIASDTNLFSHLRKNSISTLSDLTWERAAEILVDIYWKCLSAHS